MRYLDNIYGVYKQGNLLMIANSSIKFEGVLVQDRNYCLSVGLLQLLFKKLPNESLINSDDLNNYRMIIEVSSAHKKHYCVNESIRKLKSKKFYNFIAPMFQKSLVKSDSSLFRENNISEVKNGREKRKRVEQTNPEVAKKTFEPIVNPLKKLITAELELIQIFQLLMVLIIITKLIILVKMNQISQPMNIHLEEFVIVRIITLLIGDINLKVKRDTGLVMTKKLFPKSREKMVQLHMNSTSGMTVTN